MYSFRCICMEATRNTEPNQTKFCTWIIMGHQIIFRWHFLLFYIDLIFSIISSEICIKSTFFVVKIDSKQLYLLIFISILKDLEIRIFQKLGSIEGVLNLFQNQIK